jgi:hypothetical protein
VFERKEFFLLRNIGKIDRTFKPVDKRMNPSILVKVPYCHMLMTSFDVMINIDHYIQFRDFTNLIRCITKTKSVVCHIGWLSLCFVTLYLTQLVVVL